MTANFVLIGPPGTGKTEAAKRLIEGRPEGPPEARAFLTFTRAAAQEAVERIAGNTDPDVVEERFPLFRTLHSLAWRGLRAAKDIRVVRPYDLAAFAKLTGFLGHYSEGGWDDMGDCYSRLAEARTVWDRAYTAYKLSAITAPDARALIAARHRMSPFACATSGFLEEPVYQAFVSKYEDWKEKEGLADFTDMLSFALFEMAPLENTRFVALDESQDLCPLHHAIVERLFPNAEQIWWIGDDDQAIYKFAGASAELFLDRARRATAVIELTRTHRFGDRLAKFAGEIIKRISRRVPKHMTGTGTETRIDFAGSFTPVHGDYLVLHRHVRGCALVAKSYFDAGVPFRNERGYDPLGDREQIMSWQTLVKLAGGERVLPDAARGAVMLVPNFANGEEKARLVEKGGKSKLDRIHDEVDLGDLVKAGVLTPGGSAVVSRLEYANLNRRQDLEYYARVVANGHSLDLEQKTATITTIHGSKGRQAKGVVVFQAMSRRCWDDADTEHRLAYVATTRTRDSLTLCAERNLDWAKHPYEYPVEEKV